MIMMSIIIYKTIDNFKYYNNNTSNNKEKIARNIRAIS